MSSPSCIIIDKSTVVVGDMIATNDFIMGSCSDSVNTVPSIDHPTDMASNQDAYIECVRLLTRQIRRQSPKVDGSLHCRSNDDIDRDMNDLTDSTTSDDDWNEEYVKASQGIPELLVLQNTILQLQHAFYLVQQEANTAVHDASVAMQSSQYWKHEYCAAKQAVIALEQDSRVLKQQIEALTADKKKLKGACKKLLARQYAVQSQQVESYVVSALVAHEQLLHGAGISVCKNRSRTTTLDTTGTSAGDDFTALDLPFTNSPNHTSESSDGSCSPTKVSVEADSATTGSTTEPVSVSTQPPTIVAMKEHNQQNQMTQQHRGMNGFGNACHAFGRTFKFIDNHVHRKEQRPVTTEHRTDGVNTTNECVTPVDVTAVSTNSPIVGDRPYEPIRFDAITPTRSVDSNDSVTAHKRKMHSSRSPPGNKPLIDVNTLLNGPMDDSNDCVEQNNHTSMSDQVLLSLPVLPQSHNGSKNECNSLKSVSPISIPEEDEEEPLYSYEQTSTLRIKCQRYSCDPSLLRSLSIPSIPIHIQPPPPPRASPDVTTRHC